MDESDVRALKSKPLNERICDHASEEVTGAGIDEAEEVLGLQHHRFIYSMI